YIEFIQKSIYAPYSLRVTFVGSDNTVLIDCHTARNLELLQSSNEASPEKSLYGVLNHTKTIGGARLLRANLLQPPSSDTTISTRLECITELSEDEELFHRLQSVICRFTDIDHVLSICVQRPKNETLKVAEQKITTAI